MTSVLQTELELFTQSLFHAWNVSKASPFIFGKEWASPRLLLCPWFQCSFPRGCVWSQMETVNKPQSMWLPDKRRRTLLILPVIHVWKKLSPSSVSSGFLPSFPLSSLCLLSFIPHSYLLSFILYGGRGLWMTWVNDFFVPTPIEVSSSCQNKTSC